MKIQLIPGATYYAGFHRPFFILDGMITSHIEKLGATNIVFHKRSEETPPVSPAVDPNASDDWDEWISASYDGPEKTIEETKHWAWAVRHLPAHAGESMPPPAASGAPAKLPAAPAATGTPDTRPVTKGPNKWVDAVGIGSIMYLIWAIATRKPSKD